MPDPTTAPLSRFTKRRCPRCKRECAYICEFSSGYYKCPLHGRVQFALEAEPAPGVPRSSADYEDGYAQGLADVANLLGKARERIRHDHGYPIEVGPHRCPGCEVEEAIDALAEGRDR